MKTKLRFARWWIAVLAMALLTVLSSCSKQSADQPPTEKAVDGVMKSEKWTTNSSSAFVGYAGTAFVGEGKWGSPKGVTVYPVKVRARPFGGASDTNAIAYFYWYDGKWLFYWTPDSIKDAN